jgi:hypothetical protein
MAKPNKVASYMPKNPSEYWLFDTPGKASEFADYVRGLGFKVRESSFRSGPRTRNGVAYRVSMYWTAGETPDLNDINARARA